LSLRTIGDWCVIDVLEEGEVRQLASAHVDPAKAGLLEELARRYPPRADSPHATARVIRTGQTLLVSELSDSELHSLCVDEEHLRLVRRLGARSAMAVPLVARGHTLGAVAFGSAERLFRNDDVELAQELARRAAIAIDNARLYRASEEGVRIRDEFLSIAAHELFTPLTSLALVVQGLDRLTSSPEALLRATRIVDR